MQRTAIYADPEFRTRLASDSRKTLATCWAIHGELPVYPKPTVDVLQLLCSMGWDLTVDGLKKLIEDGHFEPPQKIGDLLAWQAQDIAHLMQTLDKKRAWLVGFHGDQKTEAEIEHDEAEAAKGMQMLDYYQQLPREELEFRLASAKTSPTRELLSAALRLQEQR